MKRFERYVAIGDSTTEGLEDPDGRGGYRGWANRFAEHLVRAQGPLHYANLAVRGLTARGIKETQLDRALQMKPDVATVVGGVNDLLRPRFDAGTVAAGIGQMIAALTGQGAIVLTFTMPDMTPVMPAARLLRARLEALNQRLRENVARIPGARLLDIALHDVGSDPRLWHPDRLHANSLGHERIGQGLAHTLGLTGFEAWSMPLPPRAQAGLRARITDELRWSTEYLLPWVARHARGGSSSDGRHAKRPNLTPFEI